MNIDSLEGKRCYEVFQQLDHPCPFCTNDILQPGETYTWEFFNPVVQRHFLLKDRLGIIDGRRVRTEVAVDITDQVVERQELRNLLQSEQMVLSCVRHLHQQEDLTQGIRAALGELGQSLQADRAYIFEFLDGKMDNTYEWCAHQVPSQQKTLTGLEPALVARWAEAFRQGECVIIEDLEGLRQLAPAEYDVLKPQGVHSLVAAPLEVEGKLRGFLGVDNPSLVRLRNIGSLLDTLRYFFSATMRRLADQQALRELSGHDLLTGLSNRNRFMADTAALADWQGPVGMAYMDLNGLKALNDQLGHEQGDLALQTCARILRSTFPHAQCYRIGGDEFVAVDTALAFPDFRTHVTALRRAFDRGCRYQAAVGDSWAMGPTSISQLMAQADANMYDDKRRFYRDIPPARTDSPSEWENPLLRDYNMLMSALRVSVSKHLLREDFQLIWANDYFYNMTGHSREVFHGIYGDNVGAYFARDQEMYQSLCQTIFDAYQNGKSGYEARLRIPCIDRAQHIWIKLVGIFTDEQVDGVPVVYTVFTDITDLVQTRREQDVTFDNLPGFVFKVRLLERGMALLYGNQEFESLFGQMQNGVATDLMRKNIVDNGAAIGRNLQKMRQGEPVSFEVQATNVFGGSAYYQACGGCVDWEGDTPIYLFVCIDISEIIDQRSQLRELAYVDPVTGGRNRARFELDAGGLIALSPPGTFALASLDLQKFKVVNDLFGIEAGDRTLRHVYTVIQAHLAENEFVCRLSADTFMVLLRAEAPAQMEARIQMMAEGINTFNQKLKRKYLLQMAVGVYPIDDTTLSMTQLQDRANMARKQIKGGGSLRLCSCKFYSPNDRMRLAREKDVENRMADALREGQFLVYYQPKQSLQTGKIAGAEALVRWLDPTRGLIPPDQFIPQFEDNGFIVQLDLYVFEQVCAMLRSWLDDGHQPMTISVNMSKAHLYDENFLQGYEQIRHQYRIDPTLLELELTETLIFENPQLLARVIDDIHSHGYTCSMDDFGSGYSSLNVLRQVRVDTLKLDRAFFSSEKMEDEREAAVVTSVVELAKRLKLTTVAEGIETEGQAAFLRQAGCDLFQGFLFSRPVPQDCFEAMVFEEEAAQGAPAQRP